MLTLILYAYKKNSIPIIPTFRLEALHNLGKNLETNFSEYFDYSNLKINGKKFNVITDISEIDQNLINIIDLKVTSETCRCTLWKHPELISSCPIDVKPFYLPQGLSSWLSSQYVNKKDIIDIYLPFNQNIINKYNSIHLNLKNYTCVHIRAGDYFLNDKKFGGKNDFISKISAQSIKNKIKSVSTSKDVYLMTNLVKKIKKQKNMRYNKQIDIIYNVLNYNKELLKLKDDFDCKFVSDYPSLQDIGEENNYLLYCIEILIMHNAKKKISMFHNKHKSSYYDAFIIEKLSNTHHGYT